jgi:hypothetical protein
MSDHEAAVAIGKKDHEAAVAIGKKMVKPRSFWLSTTT